MQQPTVAATVEPLPAGSVQINGAGATFPLPVYTEWAYAYQYVDPSVVINYQGIGSGGGKKGILDGTIDFAGSDSLLKDEEYTAGADLQMYPMLAGAVVNVYNIQWAKEIPTGTTLPALVLDRQTLVDIYNAKVTKWNDARIVALNPGLAEYLPNAPITVVHRSDGSGTTEIFTNALTSFSPDWVAGGASSVEWPVDKAGNGVGGKGNQGVAASVINTPNSIGYVELSFAISNQMPFASMVNKAGKTVIASADSLASAMNDFATAFDAKLTVTIVDASGDGSWPVSGYTYLILHTQNMTDFVKAQKLLEYIQWSLTDPSAAKRAGDLGYSVLPGAVRDLVLAKLGQVTVNGQPVLTK
ncbi:MAG: phosphate ABC transporter substrate-binding protein PstS [Chloroflexi bacterium GWB2_49_20]|nr:MAG: phosphate ABC transporter substrate-binding protein PstS [Chloroflexi bacterium GWB2_49_20]OGN78800.1 MAG: phosphate ABC transporter substrate-binding protein PstS [Chloroflexi bacterium GWC2_49_37]OGN85895.1 MAG: phosphate ABC transporter substrate-binding protein PstS [Chloroflexi bacterium GWD2_49_16]